MVQARLDMLRVGARIYLRGIDDAEAGSTWCGLRPLTADGLPVVGFAPRVEGLFVVTGHAMMGFLLGPLGGKLASEALLDGKMSLDLPELDPARF
jgi:D-amino-acid dehydrogenase